MHKDLKKYYGHRWRTATRPRILARAGNCCERCKLPSHFPRAVPLLRLEVAHLVIPPGQPGHDDDENLAALCPKCHHAHDYVEWARKCRETRIARKDAARPLLNPSPEAAEFMRLVPGAKDAQFYPGAKRGAL